MVSTARMQPLNSNHATSQLKGRMVWFENDLKVNLSVGVTGVMPRIQNKKPPSIWFCPSFPSLCSHLFSFHPQSFSFVCNGLFKRFVFLKDSQNFFRFLFDFEALV